MPYVPSGILYFCVWKYLILGLFLLGLVSGVRAFDLIELYPVAAFVIIGFSILVLLVWIEIGDAKLMRLWYVDEERTVSDRMGKAFIYVACCLAWPKYTRAV